MQTAALSPYLCRRQKPKLPSVIDNDLGFRVYGSNIGLYCGNIRVIFGLYWVMEKKMETTIDNDSV